ncbi:MAG: HAD family phosphatase [Treponema sp.]|nr:HAD family phosphatase [Treponema sp.]
MNITGAIFDLDGTLLDSMPYWKNAGEIYLSKLGISTKEDLNSLFSTMTLQESSCYLKKRFNLSLSESEILNIIINTIEEFYENVIPLKEGIVEFLLLLNKVNIPCVVATAADKVCALKSLNRLNITSFFDDVITTLDVGIGKTSPEIFYKSCEILKSLPQNTIVFEDSFHSLKTAKKAGFITCGIYDESSEDRQSQIQEMCDFYFKSWTEIDLNLLGC